MTIAHMIHNASAYGSDTLRDSDLLRLYEMHPDLRGVFEEVQWLRGEVGRLEDSIAAHEATCQNLREELDNA
jgi:hypothetical protein